MIGFTRKDLNQEPVTKEPVCFGFDRKIYDAIRAEIVQELSLTFQESDSIQDSIEDTWTAFRELITKVENQRYTSNEAKELIGVIKRALLDLEVKVMPGNSRS